MHVDFFLPKAFTFFSFMGYSNQNMALKKFHWVTGMQQMHIENSKTLKPLINAIKKGVWLRKKQEKQMTLQGGMVVGVSTSKPIGGGRSWPSWKESMYDRSYITGYHLTFYIIYDLLYLSVWSQILMQSMTPNFCGAGYKGWLLESSRSL